MKNTALKILLMITVISSIFLCLLLFLLVKQGNSKGGSGSKLKEFQEQYDTRNTDSKTSAPNVYQDFSDSEDLDALYDTDRHTQVFERIEALKRSGSYTQDSPLVIYNPYGTNAHSVYVYFVTQTPMKASYRVSVQEEDVPTFSAQACGGEQYTTEHEYLLIGLSAGQSNRVSLVIEDTEGASGVRTFYVTAGDRYGIGRIKLDVARGVSAESLSDGLFALFVKHRHCHTAVQLLWNRFRFRTEQTNHQKGFPH